MQLEEIQKARLSRMLGKKNQELAKGLGLPDPDVMDLPPSFSTP
jgi:hypothetical protein